MAGCESDDDPPVSCCAFLFRRNKSRAPLSKADTFALDHNFADDIKVAQSHKPQPPAAPVDEQANTAPRKRPSVSEDLREHMGWEVGKELGSGHFATVRLGRRLVDGKVAAIKVIEKTVKESQRGLAKLEAAILKRLDHPSIVKCYDMYETEERMYLFMELMEGGELFDRIVAVGHFTEQDAQDVTYKLLHAVKYLHGQGIVHRDLKPENVLLTSSGPGGEVKITDFGLGKIIDERSTVMKTACGTPGYIAPEVLCMRGYDRQCDVWSLGVIVYILLCGFPPFYADNDAQLFKRIKAGDYKFLSPYWDKVSPAAKDFVTQMLLVDPAARATVEVLLSHSWLKAQRLAAEEAEQLSTVAELSKAYQGQKRLKAVFMAARWVTSAPSHPHGSSLEISAA